MYENDNILSLEESDHHLDICEDMRILANDNKKRKDFEFYVYKIADGPVVLMTTYESKSLKEDSRTSLLPEPAL